MYYRGVPRPGQDGNEGEVTCTAESADGVHWTKPNVGLFEIDGIARQQRCPGRRRAV